MTAGRSLHVGVSVPQVFPDGQVDMDLVREHTYRAEALGFDSLWV